MYYNYITSIYLMVNIQTQNTVTIYFNDYFLNRKVEQAS